MVLFIYVTFINMIHLQNSYHIHLSGFQIWSIVYNYKKEKSDN